MVKRLMSVQCCPFAGCKLLRTIPSMNLAVVTVGPLNAVIATETGSRIC